MVHAKTIRPVKVKNSCFFQNEQFFVESLELDELESPKHEYESITASHKHRRHSSVMVKMPDC